MSRYLTAILKIVLILLALAILGGLVFANTVYVRTQPLEKNFLVPWLGARTFLQYGDNPYNGPASQRAQIVYYGRLAADGQDPLVLWLPLPVELFYFPFALVTDYALALGIWMTCLEIAQVALILLSLRLTGWRPPRLLLPLVLFFSIFWVYGAFSLASGSGAGFIALALAGFLLALRDGHDELAGGLLLLAGSVVSLSGLLLIFMFWWIVFQRRWRILWGFLMSLVLLLGLSFLFLPGWLLPYLRGMILHSTYDPALSTVNIFATWSPVVGPRLAWVMAGTLLLLLFIEWGAALRNDFRNLLWTVNLTLAAMPILGISIATANYIILNIPLMILLGILAEGRSSRGRWSAGILLFVMLIGSWVLTAILISSNKYTALAQTLFLFLPLLLIPGLYWMRWRFTRSASPEFELPR